MKEITVTNELIARYFSGDIHEEEENELLKWLNESPENTKQLFILKDIYDGAAGKRLFEEAKTEEGWVQLQSRLKYRGTLQQSAPSMQNKVIPSAAPSKQNPSKFVQQKPAEQWYMRMIRYAAVLLIGVLGTAAVFYFFNKPKLPQHAAVSTYHVATERGERATVTLPDGSFVRLNACSSLSYQSDYGTSAREVEFSGEAFFDVQTNADIPFTVKTFGLNIKAYGTVFNVKAYLDEEMVETTLVDGVVEIESHNNRHIVTLKPNQVIAIPKLLQPLIVKQDPAQTESPQPAGKPVTVLPGSPAKQDAILRNNVKTDEYTSWKDDKWIIKSESLESLAKKIERKYDVSILIEDEASKKYVFSGTLRNYPLEQVLEIIRMNAPIQYAIREKTVSIKEEKQLKKQYQNLIHSPQ